MCKILEEERAAGREEGRQEGIRVFICDNLEEGKSREQIVEKLMKRFMLDREAAEGYYRTFAD